MTQSRWVELQKLIVQHNGNPEWVAEALYAWLIQYSEGEEEFTKALVSFIKKEAISRES